MANDIAIIEAQPSQNGHANPLAKLEQARHLLAACHSVADARQFISMAAAAKAYARQMKLGKESVQFAAEQQLRGERELGKILAVTPRNKGANGKAGPGRGNKNAIPKGYSVLDEPTLSDIGVTLKESSKAQKLAKLPDDKFEAIVNGELSITTATNPNRTQFTGENEWYTPDAHIEAAREFLGAIDLDPASSKQANKTIRARRIFTLDDDGLARDWAGRVWLNPPYAQPHIANFVEKMVSEFQVGRVAEAVMLTHNYTDTAWFHLAESACASICFTRGRIKFYSPSGEIAAPTQGQAFFYFGPRRDEFASAFKRFGFVR